jgi:uncharacterized protein with HEPN domain
VKDDRIYIDHILECIEWITRYMAEGRDGFFYLGIRLDRIWEIIERDLPAFRATLESIRIKIEK